MYYIEDSRFETKGPYFRSPQEAREVLEAEVAELSQAGAVVTGFETGAGPGYTVRLDRDRFELSIQVIN